MKTTVVARSESRTESRAIYVALASAGVGLLTGLALFFSAERVTLFERGVSLGSVASIMAGVVALAVYLLAASYHERPLEKRVWARTEHLLNIVSLAIVFGLLAFLSCALVFFIISIAFRGATVDMWAASVLLALSLGVASYGTYLMAVGMNAMRVSAILALFLVSGTFISMMTASDPLWWDVHFSSLGAGGGISGYAFNATLIIAGLVIVALSKYIIDDFTRLQQQGHIPKQAKTLLMRGLLAGIGISLAFVGLFVYDVFPLTHNIAAFGMAALFGVIIIILPWLVPGFLPAFFVASYALIAGLIVSAWLFWGVGYFNLTIFELVAAAVIFTWLALFVRHVAALLDDETVKRPRAKEESNG